MQKWQIPLIVNQIVAAISIKIRFFFKDFFLPNYAALVFENIFFLHVLCYVIIVIVLVPGALLSVDPTWYA